MSKSPSKIVNIDMNTGKEVKVDNNPKKSITKINLLEEIGFDELNSILTTAYNKQREKK